LTAVNGFFLAMAHWQLGDKNKSRAWYERAAQSMAAGRQLNRLDLGRFRQEAARLLGRPVAGAIERHAKRGPFVRKPRRVLDDFLGQIKGTRKITEFGIWRGRQHPLKG